ncbi:PLDc N-terminal domain-containing protein [Aureibaculum luteum]
MSKRKFNENEKVVWVFVVLLFNFIETIIYFTIGSKLK